MIQCTAACLPFSLVGATFLSEPIDQTSCPVTPDVILTIAYRLRFATKRLLASQSRQETVKSLSDWAASWFDPDSQDRLIAEAIRGEFPYAMVKDNLDVLLRSINEESISAIIESEGVQEICGYPLVGHVIAANTPLLAWGSVLRALIMGCSSLVKVSSQDDGLWISLFVDSLTRAHPLLARCVDVLSWPGDEDNLNDALCSSVDALMVYGSDAAIESFEVLAEGKTTLIGYGHRVSIGIADYTTPEIEVTGFARDVVTYDQAGCLSPQMIFFLGSSSQAEEFSIVLAKQLLSVCEGIGELKRSVQSAQAIRTHRAIARMSGCQVIEDETMRWTVVNARNASIYPPGNLGIVHVRCIGKLADILQWTTLYSGKFQGCAIASMRLLDNNVHIADGFLETLGFSRICRPGELQTPPISWKQDNLPVLRLLGTG